MKNFSIGASARAFAWAFDRQASRSSSFRERFNIIGVHGPREQVRLVHFTQLRVAHKRRLVRVGGDDFEVASRSKLKQRIARPAPRMHAAESGVKPRAFLDERDAMLEIVNSQEDVVKISRYVRRAVRGEGGRKRGDAESATSD